MNTPRILMVTCEGSRTKRQITLGALLALAAWAQASYADDGPTFTAQTNIDITFSPFEIDAQSTLEGPGLSLNGLGNAICSWGCGNALTPGSSLNPSFTEIDFGPVGPAGTLTLGGQQIICQGPGANAQCSLLAAAINTPTSITFPTNGQNFTVTVPATVPELTGSVFGPAGVQPFNIQGSSGELVLYFSFGEFGPSYEFAEAVFSTPEPGALDLMAAGLVLLGVAVNRRKRQ